MDEAHYWQLIDLLEGVATEESVARIDAVLADRPETDGNAFVEMTEAYVEQLLDACSVPASHMGDTAERIAAAVIASGRGSFEEALVAGVELQPADWNWRDSEALLVAGFDIDDALVSLDGAGAASTWPVQLTWLAREAPAGLEPHADDRHLDPHQLARRIRPFPDPEWDTAWEELRTDELVAPHLDLIRQWDLRVAVVDSAELEFVAWPSPEQPDVVQLMVPLDLVNSEQTRAHAYFRAVTVLVDELVGESHPPAN